jgi:hypothetical protein
MFTRTRRNTQGSLNIKTKEMGKSKPEIVLRAEKEAITIMRWAKSCETPEQFDNVEKFNRNHKWMSNIAHDKDVQYYVGATHGFIIALRKTKFKID